MLADVTQGLVVEFPHELPEHAMRLMETLGVTVQIDPVRKPIMTGGVPVAPPNVHFGGPAKRISGATCAKCPDPGECRRVKFCWRAQRAERLLQRRAKQHEREAMVNTGLDALNRMDRGEPQRAEPPRLGRRERWDSARVIAAFQSFHERHGRWPKTTDQEGRNAKLNRLPAFATMKLHVGTLTETIAAAQNGAAPAAVKPPPAEKSGPATAMPDPPTAALAATLADKARHLLHLTEQLEQARRQVTDLEAQVRQIATEIAA